MKVSSPKAGAATSGGELRPRGAIRWATASALLGASFFTAAAQTPDTPSLFPDPTTRAGKLQWVLRTAAQHVEGFVPGEINLGPLFLQARGGGHVYPATDPAVTADPHRRAYNERFFADHPGGRLVWVEAEYFLSTGVHVSNGGPLHVGTGRDGELRVRVLAPLELRGKAAARVPTKIFFPLQAATAAALPEGLQMELRTTQRQSRDIGAGASLLPGLQIVGVEGVKGQEVTDQVILHWLGEGQVGVRLGRSEDKVIALILGAFTPETFQEDRPEEEDPLTLGSGDVRRDMSPHWAGPRGGLLRLQGTQSVTHRTGDTVARAFTLDLSREADGRLYESLVQPLKHPASTLVKTALEANDGAGVVLRARSGDDYFGRNETWAMERRFSLGVTLFQSRDVIHETSGALTLRGEEYLGGDQTVTRERRDLLGGRRQLSWNLRTVTDPETGTSWQLGRAELHEHDLRTSPAQLKRAFAFARMLGLPVLGGASPSLLPNLTGSLGSSSTNVVLEFKDWGLATARQVFHDEPARWRAVYARTLVALEGRDTLPPWGDPGALADDAEKFVAAYNRKRAQKLPVRAEEDAYRLVYGPQYSLQRDARDYQRLQRAERALQGNFVQAGTNLGKDFWATFATLAQLAGPDGFQVHQLSVNGEHLRVLTGRDSASETLLESRTLKVP